MKAVANLPKYTIPIDADFFRLAMKAEGISQNELAKLLGIDKGAMSLVFSGKRHLSLKEAYTIANRLKLDLKVVIKRSGELDL